METRRSKRKDADSASALPSPEPKRSRQTSRTTKPSADKGKEKDKVVPQLQLPATQQRRTRRSTRSSTEHSTQPPVLNQTAPPAPDETPAPTLEAADKPPQGNDLPSLLEGMEKGSRQQRSSRPDPAEGTQPKQEEDKQEPAGGEGGRSFPTPSSALQGLLRKLGAGFEEPMSMGGMSGSRIKGIVNGLKQVDDESQQLSALTELCELLAISTEESLATFPVEQVVPLLVSCLNMEHHADMMLFSARAMTFLADVLPSSCGAIVRHGAVPVFCARLLTIEYIDLAEQSLQALEKLSHEHPQSLLQNGGLVAVLSYLDFFPTGVQRVAVATAANMCAGLTTENADAVREAIPILTNVLEYPDTKVVDNACLALTHIADNFASKPELLEMLNTDGLIGRAVQLVSISSTGSMTSQLSVGTFFGLLKLLSTCASGSDVVAQTLLQSGVADILHNLLGTSALLGSGGTAASVLRSSDQLYEVLSLACELLPPVPDSSTVVMEGLPATAPPAGRQRQHAQFLADNPVLLENYGRALLPLLLQVYSSTVLPQVRQRCLSSILRILYYATPAMLEDHLKDLSISGFVAQLLGARDPAIVAAALHMAELLMEKLPNVFKVVFLREGVVHAVEQLAATAPAQAAATAAVAPPAPAAPAAAPPPAQPPAPAAAAASTSGKARAPVTRASARSKGAVPPAEDKPATGKDKAPEPSPPQRPAPPAEAAPAAAKPATAPVPVAKPAVSLRDAVALRGKKFKASYFSEGTSGGLQGLETEGLKLMRALCGRIAEDPAALPLMLSTLSDTSDSVSVFEFLSSGAVGALLAHLRGEDLEAGPAREAGVLSRLRGFVEAALPPGSSSSPPLLPLVRKLQAALSSLETFPVVCAPSRPSTSGRSSFNRSSSLSSGGGSLSSGLAALTHPFKLRLVRHGQERTLKEYPPNIVLIEPLATMTAIEDFLWPKVMRNEEEARREEAAARPQARTTEAGKAAAAAGKAAAAGAAAKAAAAATDGAAAAIATAARAAPAVAVAAAAAAPTTSRATHPAPSKAQPIPETDGNRRMTRAAAARARAEAQARADEASRQQDVRRTAGAAAESDDHDPMSEDEECIMMGDDEAAAEEDGGAPGSAPLHHDDDEMEEGIADEAMYDEDDDDEEEMDGEDGELELGSMTVHDLHVGSDGVGSFRSDAGDSAGLAEAAAAAAAAAASAAAASSEAAAAAAASAAAAAATAAGAASSSGAAAGGAWSGRSAAHAVPQRLVFYLGEQPLPAHSSVFQAIQQVAASQMASGRDDGEEPGEDAGVAAAKRSRRMWDEMYTFQYRLATAVAADTATASTSRSAAALPPAAALGALRLEPRHRHLYTPLADLLSAGLPAELSSPDACKEVLQLLQLLEAINRLAPRLQASWGTPESCSKTVHLGRVPREEFGSGKLGGKLAAQLKDVLSICGGSMPSWCRQLVFAAKFLFTFESRRRHFYCTAFGINRALQHMQSQQQSEGGGPAVADRDGRELRISRLQRQKVRVSRKRILESAAKVMELYAKARTVLELEYFGEVGTGLGPTLEFYTLLSHELQRRSLGMWRSEDAAKPAPMAVDGAPAPPAEQPSVPSPDLAKDMDPADYVVAPYGLFPAPLPPSQRATSKAPENFRLLGRTVAKALQDSRLLDLPLSYVFYRAALGRPLDLHDVARIDPHLGQSLERLAAALRAWQAGGRTGPLCVDGAPIEDLCLTFTLPGHPEYELREDGANVSLSSANLEEYLEAVLEATLGEGVAVQLEAFREGFNEVFPLHSLDAFYEDEVEAMLCGSGEFWAAGQLAECIKFDHGYTAHSAPVRHFLEVLSELDATDQRRFLRFVTGCPRLPPGGIAVLQPRLTVVRKHPSNGASEGHTPSSTPSGPGSSLKEAACCTAADGDLPSVMTCANYIKLPPYSSKTVMQQRLLFAIREGQGSFDLS